MSDEDIVIADAPVLLLGGAVSETARQTLEEVLSLTGDGTLIAAADGGARLALMAGRRPHAVIGDFDSLTDADLARLDPATLHRFEEQETTDFDKALRSISAPVVLGVGFHGARTDHHLAAMSVLARHPGRPCVLVGPDDLTCLCPPTVSLDLEAGSWLSLFPLGNVSGRSTGLEWPIDGLAFSADTRVGTSNRVSDGPVTLAMNAPRMLLILPRPALRPLLAALSRSDARWPVRGR